MLKQEVNTRIQQKINSAFAQHQRSFTVFAQAIVADSVRGPTPRNPAETFMSIYKDCEKTLNELRGILSQAVIDILHAPEFEPTDEFAVILKKVASSKLHPLSHTFTEELRTMAGKLGLAETMDWEHSLQEAVGFAVEEIKNAIDSHIQSRRKDEERTMDALEVRQRSEEFLHFLYDMTGGDENDSVEVDTIIKEMGLENSEYTAIKNYLKKQKFFRFVAYGTISMTQDGIAYVENNVTEPERPPRFPPQTGMEPKASPMNGKTKTTANNKVFVVHGRNLPARDAMFTFLRTIGLQPIEWSQAVKKTGKPSPYIGEILDVAFSTAQAVVVLMTPDDEARLREPFRGSDDQSYEIALTPQARPNVLFEAGMAMGRHHDRTVLVELGNLRPFSDTGGRYVIKLSHTSQKRQELAQHLERAGCPVDLSGTDWHSAGDFSISPDTKISASETVVQEPVKSGLPVEDPLEPTNEPVPQTLSTTRFGNNTRVTLTWAYEQGEISADRFFVYWADNRQPTHSDESSLISHTSRSFSRLLGPGERCVFGIAAARGEKIGPIVTSMSNPDWDVVGI